jgi:triosephosphate isomerase (TIM)
MATPIAAGNWKMNLEAGAARELAQTIVSRFVTEYQGPAEVILAPSFTFLADLSPILSTNPHVFLAGQNMHEQASGAFTGEISAEMLLSVGCTYVILGHSERRQYFGEDNALLAKKIDRALEVGLKVIYCIGETLEQREAGQTLEINQSQLSEGAFHLSDEQFGQLVIAYEPVWAIGTGKTATPEQAQEVHAAIRQQIAGQYGDHVARQTSILYGGSVKPDNAETLFGQADIDGGLVGGASLKADDFISIIQALQ